MQREFVSNGIHIGCYIQTVTNTDRFRDSFTKKEKIEIKKTGMLATKKDTAKKIVSYTEKLSWKGGIGIDNRVNTEHLQCLNLQQV